VVAPPGKTRKRLVTSTIQLLRRQGAHGTGLQEVLAHSGAPRGSLYFHFPGGKEELVREAIQEAAEVVDRWLKQSLDKGPSAAAAVEAFILRYGEHVAKAGFAEGCPIAGVALDVGPEDERLRTVCDWALTGWVTMVAERLRADGWNPEEAESLALTSLSALEGGLILSRARRSSDPLNAVATQMRTLLTRESPSPLRHWPLRGG
jgi:TetR/AcrR family transcriptional repressor of lmrAB and yxaGH operons